MDDGTGPRNGALARSVQAQRDLRQRQGKLTWADELKAAVFQLLAEDDPERLRQALGRTSDVLVAWRRDLDARGSARPSSDTPPR